MMNMAYCWLFRTVRRPYGPLRITLRDTVTLAAWTGAVERMIARMRERIASCFHTGIPQIILPKAYAPSSVSPVTDKENVGDVPTTTHSTLIRDVNASLALR